MKRFEVNAANFPNTFVSGKRAESETIVPKGPTIISQDCAEPFLREQISIKELETQRFCKANAWSGFPTFGSVYSTYKLEIIQTLKSDNKEFISLMLQILIQKYPRLKTLFLELSSSDSDITETFSYIIRKAERTEEHCCKQERREFFNTILKPKIVSNILKKETYSEKKEKKDENLPTTFHKKSVKKVAATSRVYDISSYPNQKSIQNAHFDFKFKSVSLENKANFYEYLKNLKIKYALIQTKVAKRIHQQEYLEKKLKILFTKQRNYKYKIKKYRKEMIEFDSVK